MAEVIYTLEARLDSIKAEAEGRGTSILMEETKYSVREWKRFHDEELFEPIYDALFRHASNLDDPLKKGVSDATFASAMYEWASKAWWDDTPGDYPRFELARRNGGLMCGPLDKSGSVGPFQSYAATAFQAIGKIPRIRQFLKDWKHLPGAGRVASTLGQLEKLPPGAARSDPVEHYCRTPTTATATAARDATVPLANALSDYDTMTTPIISFIAKLAQTLGDYANRVPAALLPNKLLDALFPEAFAYLILRVESHNPNEGSREDYLKEIVERLKKAKPLDLVKLTNGKGYEQYIRYVPAALKPLGVELSDVALKRP